MSLSNADEILPQALDRTAADPIADAPTFRPAGPAYRGPIRQMGPTTFADYELLEEVARGGMGVIYKARQVALNRTVALKMILGGQLASQEDVQRFYTEAEVAATLDHPGIVPIYEVGQHEGQHYFSMGFVDGTSLAACIAQGPMPPRRAAELLKTVAEAMAFAHQRGVVHRDLKPANILLDREGRPRVTDFGIAKCRGVDSGLTGSGEILGTPGYMPPEQAAGRCETVGPLADVYSLGAILYCLLTSHPPFQSAAVMDTLIQVLEQEPVPPRRLDSRVPADLETICLKCLEKQPLRRYASAAELAAELGRYLAGEPIHARPIGSFERGGRWCKRKPVLAGLIALAGASIVSGLELSTYFAVLANERAWLAQSETLRANQKAGEAQRALQSAQSSLYYHLVAFAERAINAHDWAQGRDFLSQCPSDLRGWEWRYLARLCERNSANNDPVEIQACDSSTLAQLQLDRRGQLSVVCTTPAADLASRGTLNTYDVKDGRLIQTISGLDLRQPLAIDGGACAVARADGSIQSWDQGRPEAPRMLNGHLGEVLDLTFTAAGSLLSVGVDKNLYAWDLSNAGSKRIHSLAAAGRLTCTADGSLVAVFSNSAIQLWDLVKDRKRCDLPGHRGRVEVVVFCQDGSRVAAASEDRMTRIWSTAGGPPLASFALPEGRVIDVAWLGPHDQSVATVVQQSSGGLILETHPLGNHRAGSLASRGAGGLSREDTVLSCIAFEPGGTRAAVVSSEAERANDISLIDTTSGMEVFTLRGHAARVTHLAFDPDARRLASADADGRVILWDSAAQSPR